MHSRTFFVNTTSLLVTVGDGASQMDQPRGLASPKSHAGF